MVDGRRVHKSPKQSGQPANPEPEYLKKRISTLLKISNLPPVDYNDLDAVSERCNTYFQICMDDGMKPGAESFALAFHESATNMANMISGHNYKISPACREILKQAKNIIRTMWEQYMQDGKINPVSGIFIAKNSFGYQDQTYHVIAPEQPTITTATPEQLEQKYADVIDVTPEEKSIAKK